jgi:hypothetical protein
LKKDAGEGAMKTGRRVSKGLKSNQWGDKSSNKGNVYYEYRPNRLDVKQPKKRQTYPKLADGGMMAKGGINQGRFYEGQSILIKPITTKSLIDALPEWNKYANKELVIESIEFDKPYKKVTESFVRNTGEKVPFNIYLND